MILDFRRSYTVEKKEKSKTNWMPVSRQVMGLTMDVSKLNEDTQYEFRVCAVNVHGTSEPLDTEKPVLIKAPYGRLIISEIIHDRTIVLCCKSILS